METQTIGSWAFILGVIIAIVGGAVGGYVIEYAPWIVLALVILGLVVGFINIGQKEVNDFLIAAIALTLVGIGGSAAQLSTIPAIGAVVQAIVGNIVVFVAPAALVVALKSVYSLAKSPA